MGQINEKLRSARGGIGHWCPGCDEIHVIPDSWQFDGNLDFPTFQPSIKITGKQKVMVDGEWMGDWRRDANGKPLDYCCHYFLHAGVLKFCGDCTHHLSNQTVELPDLPVRFRDGPI